MEDALGIGDRQLEAERFGIEPLVIPVAAQTEAFDLERAQRLLERLLERPADRHRFADAFHLRRQCRIGLRKFLEGEPRNFYDAIIDRGLEARRRLAG